MVLARLLLKMRGYRIIRVLIIFKISYLGFVFYFFLFLRVLRGYLAVMVCIRQLDLKSFVAYSSVSHISLSLRGLIVSGVLRFKRAFYMFLRHRLVSPIMFFFRNLFYERIRSRIYMRVRGILKGFKYVRFFIFLVLVVNMGFPPFLNFVGEVFIYFNVLKFNLFFGVRLGLLMLITGVVMIKFFTKIFRSSRKLVISGEMNNRELVLSVLGFGLLIWISFIVLLV